MAPGHRSRVGRTENVLYVLYELHMWFHKVSYKDMQLVTIFTYARNVLVSFILFRFQKTSLAVETEVHHDLCGLLSPKRSQIPFFVGVSERRFIGGFP